MRAGFKPVVGGGGWGVNTLGFLEYLHPGGAPSANSVVLVARDGRARAKQG